MRELHRGSVSLIGPRAMEIRSLEEADAVDSTEHRRCSQPPSRPDRSRSMPKCPMPKPPFREGCGPDGLQSVPRAGTRADRGPSVPGEPMGTCRIGRSKSRSGTPTSRSEASRTNDGVSQPRTASSASPESSEASGAGGHVTPAHGTAVAGPVAAGNPVPRDDDRGRRPVAPLDHGPARGMGATLVGARRPCVGRGRSAEAIPGPGRGIASAAPVDRGLARGAT